MSDGWTRDELQARADQLRTLMVDTAAAQFAELQALRAQMAAVQEILADRGIVNDSSAYELRDLLLEALAAKGSRL